MCGELRVSMYGTRDAAMNWATGYGETLKKAGLVQGKSSACLFYHAAKDVAVMSHGDDFVAVGNPKHLAETESALSEKYIIKTEMLGADTGDVKEVKILIKIVRLTGEGVELEADPRHAELVVRELGVGNCRTTRVPGSKMVSERSEARVTKPSRRAEVSLMEGENSEGELDQIGCEDEWVKRGEDGIWRRTHKASRRSLFTPCGTSGSPERPSSLGGKRITEGTYILSGENFIIVDNWKDKRDAHRRLSEPWTGSTTFEVDFVSGSVRQNLAENTAIKKTQILDDIKSHTGKHGVFESSIPGSTGFVQPNASPSITILQKLWVHQESRPWC